MRYYIRLVSAIVMVAGCASAVVAASPPAGAEPTKSAVDIRIEQLEATIARLEALLSQPQKDERIAALEATVQALQSRVQELSLRAEGGASTGSQPSESRSPATAPAPDPAPMSIDDPVAPSNAEPPAAVAPGGGAATRLPNISVVGNVIFSGGPSGTENRGRFNTQEVEISLQDRVAPNLSAGFFLAAEKEADWVTSVEEGYLNWSNPLGLRNVSARFGKLRAPFGKLNPTHPHQWRFIDQPAAITAFLGPDGLNADGAMLQYLLPIPGVFANLELGGWQTRSEAEDGLGFAGAGRDATSARLWLGKEVGRDKELEVGVSRYQGRGQPEGLSKSRRLAITGLDLTFRSFPSAYRRWALQAEAIQHHTSGAGPIRDRNRWGGYLDLSYRPNQYWEAGLRADSTRYPYPADGQETAGNLYFTRFLTEQTSLRLQLRHGSRPDRSGFSEVFLQFLFGAGPHFHLLQ